MNRAYAHADMIHVLDQLQEELKKNWIKGSLPPDWNGLDTWAPVARHKTRVTVRLDTDMVRWFRKLGPGYGARMNRVLRVYWTALLAGHVKAHMDDDVTPRLLALAHQMREEMDG